MKTIITKEEVSKVLKIFNINQLSEINYGLESGVDISVYMDPKYNSGQMREIRKGLEQGLDVSKYSDTKFDAFRMEQIRDGLKSNIDVLVYWCMPIQNITAIKCV